VTAAHRSGARREREAARTFGVRRTQYRLLFEAAPDIELVPMPVGPPMSVEVKTRAELPKLITKALAQAQRYEPAAVPAVVISETGGTALIVLPLKAFCTIAGVGPNGFRGKG
jgi:hypothetical protein